MDKANLKLGKKLSSLDVTSPAKDANAPALKKRPSKQPSSSMLGKSFGKKQESSLRLKIGKQQNSGGSRDNSPAKGPQRLVSNKNLKGKATGFFGKKLETIPNDELEDDNSS